jgi:hypothetical protein
MRPSPSSVLRHRLRTRPRLGADGENLEIGQAMIPVFREPRISTRTNVRLSPGTIVPLLESRQVGGDLWHRIQLPPGPAWVVGASGGTTYAYATSDSPRQAPEVLRSVNGWPVISKGDESKLELVQIPGVPMALRAAPGAANPLAAMVQWWHNHVEPVQLLWSYSLRQIHGTNKWSNHASGTAIDINGCWREEGKPLASGCSHPYKEATVPERLKPAIRAKAKALGLVWGGDWSPGKLDEMHFEVGMDPARFQAFWEKRGMPGLGPESSASRVRDTLTSLVPGAPSLTREARQIKDTAGNVGMILGAGALAGLALWMVFGRPR